jgi:S-formylglutathione hydrolase
MYSYITKELPEILEKEFSLSLRKVGIFGHSMGGHGALICFLKNINLYQSVSAFAPIANPTQCPWGIKAFTGYLGSNQETWKDYDATELIKNYQGPPITLFIDQGSADSFLKEQLKPDNLIQAAQLNKSLITVEYRLQADYDHSYWFISTFINDHLEFHARYLLQ